MFRWGFCIFWNLQNYNSFIDSLVKDTSLSQYRSSQLQFIYFRITIQKRNYCLKMITAYKEARACFTLSPVASHW